MRQRFKSIDPALAHACFTYDPGSGSLKWKVRRDVGKGVNGRFAGKEAGHRHTCTVGKTYIQVRVRGELHYAHRIAWVMMRGPIPDGMEVDHIDGDGTNTKWENLRLVSSIGNKRNMRRLCTNTSGHTGVYRDSGRETYSARVTVNDKFITILAGVSFERAVAAREKYNRENGFHPNHGADRPL